MPTDLTHRELRFGLVWTVGSGAIFSAVVLAAVIATKSFRLADFWMVSLLLGTGCWSTSIVQQVLLDQEQIPAHSWWLTSLLGWVFLSCFGLFSGSMAFIFVGRNPSLGAFHVFFTPLLFAMLAGAIFGAIQMMGCSVLCRKPLIWPLTNALAFAIVLLLLSMRSLAPGNPRVTSYLFSLAAGLAYGLFTCTALAWARRSA